MGIQGVPITTKKIIDAIVETRGIVSRAARLLKCHPSTVYARIDEDAEIKQALLEARRERDRDYEDQDSCLVDSARQALAKRIDSGCVPSILFTLKTKGAFEGDSGPGSQTINLKFKD